MKKKIILIDAFAVIHRSYHALPDLASKDGRKTGAVYGFVNAIFKIKEAFETDLIIACFDTCAPTHRHDMYDDYKAGRAEQDDDFDEQVSLVYEACDVMNVVVAEKEGLEADDIIGTLANNYKKEGNEVIILTLDQDLLQLIEKNISVYLIRKSVKDTILLTEKNIEGFLGFSPKLLPDYKGLAGDASDNIKGIKGIGKKTAENLVTSVGTIEDVYKSVDKIDVTDRVRNLLKEGEKDALFSKDLATIHTNASISLPKPQILLVDKELAISFFESINFNHFIARIKKENPNYVKDEPVKKTKVNVEDRSDEYIKTTIAFWILDSEKTNPTEEEMLDDTKSKDLSEAYKKLEKRIKEEGIEFVLNKIELPLIPILKKMHEAGILMDAGALEKARKEYQKEVDVLEKKIWKYAGHEFNINSPKQVGEVLFDELKIDIGKKKRSTREEMLLSIQDSHPIISELLKYREVKKLLSTYIEAFPKLIKEDGRIHTTFIQYGTTTGRIASKNPNLQNIPIKTPRGKVIRDSFIAKKGFKLVAFDYSQIEFRIAALLAKDDNLIQIFSNGNDLHSEVAKRVFNANTTEEQKALRGKSKAISYGILYGMGANALQKSMGKEVKKEDAQQFLDDYAAAFPRLMLYRQEILKHAKENGYTETFFGRRRIIPEIHSSLAFIRGMAERAAINAPIQGTQSDIIKLAMIEIDKKIDKDYRDKAFMLLQIHDELLFEVENSVLEKFSEDICNIMENICPKFGKFPVEKHAATSWGQMK